MPRKRRRHHRPRQRQGKGIGDKKQKKKSAPSSSTPSSSSAGESATNATGKKKTSSSSTSPKKRSTKGETILTDPSFGGVRWFRRQKKKAYEYWKLAIGSRALASRLLGSKRENATVSTTVFLYSRGRVLESVFTKPKEALYRGLAVFTQMGRAKLQKHRQSIAYPKFCLDLIEERIDEVYVNVIGQIARYYAIYPDGRLAVCQVPTLNSRELRDLFRMLEINPMPLKEESTFSLETVLPDGSSVDAKTGFASNYFIPGFFDLCNLGRRFLHSAFPRRLGRSTKIARD